MLLYNNYAATIQMVFPGKRLARPKKAFVLWLTGLSGFGKTTLANRIYEFINKKGMGAEKLDVDVVLRVFFIDRH